MSNDLFTEEDRAVLAQSMERAIDDALLVRLMATARALVAQRYVDELRIYPAKLEAYERQRADHERDLQVWTEASREYDRRSRRYEGELANWDAASNREGWPKPVPPVDPGPRPIEPEKPAEPVEPSDNDAVIALMQEQRAAVARAVLEDKAPLLPVRDELQEQIDFIRWVVGEPASAPADVHNFPENLTDKLSDWDTVPDEANLTTADLTEEVIQKLTAAKRKKFTELLNVELAELQQERGGPREDLPREAEIEKLLGLFARVGEM